MSTYKIISGVDPERFENAVINALNQGWKLAGGVSVCVIPGDYRIFYQAVTKPL